MFDRSPFLIWTSIESESRYIVKLQKNNAHTKEIVAESELLLPDSLKKAIRDTISTCNDTIPTNISSHVFDTLKVDVSDFIKKLTEPNLTLKKSTKPEVLDFDRYQYFKVVEMYIHVQLPKDWYVFFPDETVLRKIKGHSWIKKQEEVLSVEETWEFIKKCRRITPTKEQYRDHLVNVCRKLVFIGNSPESILHALEFHSFCRREEMSFIFESATLKEIVKEASLRSYSPRTKVVVFNPDYSNHMTFFGKKRIQERERKKLAAEVLKVLEGTHHTLKELVERTGYSRSSVINLIEELGINFKTKSQVNSSKIQAYQHAYPNATIKECAKHFGKSRDWVRPHWTKPLTKGEKVKAWRKEFPDKSQADCQKELGFGIATIKRNWK